MSLHASLRRRAVAFSALGALVLLAGCGGRAANPVDEAGNFDLLLSCAHIDAESHANARRIEDLSDERNTNRLRNLTRVPGALLGNPLSALALADTSRAIYIEIDALEARNERLEALKEEKACGAQEGDGFEATLVGGVVGGAASFLDSAVSMAGEAVGAVGDAADQAADAAGSLFSDDEAETETMDAETTGAEAEAAATEPPVETSEVSETTEPAQ